MNTSSKFINCKVMALIVGMSVASVQAQTKNDSCQSILTDILKMQAQKQHLRQLEKVSDAADLGCLGEEGTTGFAKAQAINNRILNRWSDQILDDVIPSSAKAQFDSVQLQRLQRHTPEIKAMQPYIGSKKTEWLPALLNVIIEKPATSQLFSQELQPIFEGYVNDMKNNALSETVMRSELGEFISLLDQGLSLLNTSEQTYTSRAFGDSPQVAMLKNKIQARSMSFASSEENKQPNSINTPIRFEYNSTELSGRGEQEYKTMLALLTSDTTKSIFLIGHASPEGSSASNCTLSKQRVQALKDKLVREGNIPASQISIAWAGENIPLELGQANEFLRNTDRADADVLENVARRRVEIEINGQLLKQRYAGRFCEE